MKHKPVNLPEDTTNDTNVADNGHVIKTRLSWIGEGERMINLEKLREEYRKNNPQAPVEDNA